MREREDGDEYHLGVMRSFGGYRMGLYIGGANQFTQKYFLAESVTVRDVEIYEEGRPILEITDAEAVLLMDSLWRAGIRPSNHKSESTLNDHLQDMRAIAFAKLEIEKPR